MIRQGRYITKSKRKVLVFVNMDFAFTHERRDLAVYYADSTYYFDSTRKADPIRVYYDVEGKANFIRKLFVKQNGNFELELFPIYKREENSYSDTIFIAYDLHNKIVDYSQALLIIEDL